MTQARFTPSLWLTIPVLGSRVGSSATPTSSSSGRRKVDLENALYQIKATYTNPVTQAETPLPRHQWFLLKVINHRPTDLKFRSRISSKKGISVIRKPAGFPSGLDTQALWYLSWYPADKQARKQYIDKGEVWIDLDKNEFVADDVELLSTRKRSLMRITKWRSDFKARADRGGVSPGPNNDWDTTGRIRGKDIAPFGLSKPWHIEIDKDWYRASATFQYYDWQAGKVTGMPRGLRAITRTLGGLVLGAGTVADADGKVHLVNEVTRAHFAKMRPHVIFVTKDNTAVDLSVAPPAAGAVDNRLVELSAAQSIDTDTHYLVPEGWASRAMELQPLAVSGPEPRRVWDGFVKTESNLQKADWLFNLDDAVLKKQGGGRVTLPANSRVTLFDCVMAIRNPDASFPHLSTEKVTGAPYLRGEEVIFDAAASNTDKRKREGMTRVILHEGRFFDVRQRRLRGTLGLDKFVGAREVIEDDHPKVEYFKTGKNPDASSTDSLLSVFGCYAAHLFPDAMRAKGLSAFSATTEVQLCHLLVYVPLTANQGPSVPPADFQKLFPALLEAAKNWDQLHPAHQALSAAAPSPPLKNYVLTPNTTGTVNNGDRVVKLRHFFGPVTDAAASHFDINVFFDSTGNVRAHADLGFMELPSHAIGVTGSPNTDLDGVQARRDTVAHEFGHVLSHHDEYQEHMDVPATTTGVNVLIDPRIPRFNQNPDVGKPYVADVNGMMRSNHTLRLRYMWPHATTINRTPEMSAAVGGVNTWTPHYQDYNNGSPLPLTFAPDAQPRPGDATTPVDPWAPDFQQALVGGRASVLLFALGADEGVQDFLFRPAVGTPGPTRYDAMALVRMKLCSTSPERSRRTGTAGCNWTHSTRASTTRTTSSSCALR